jgi:hypothetical protein
MTHDIEEARWRLWCGASLYAVQVLVCVFCGLCVLHMWNTYPKFSATNTQLQHEATEFWELCQQNTYIRSSKHAACFAAQSEAAMNVRLLSLEQTCLELVQHFNILSGLYTKDSPLSYVLLRTMDNVMSSSVLLLLCVGALLLWMIWTFQQGPLQQYQWYRMMREQGAQQVLSPSTYLHVKSA